MPAVAIRRAVSPFRCTRLELLLYVLMVDFQCVVQAGKLLQTTTTGTIGPTEAPRVTEETDGFGVNLELNVSGRVLKICRNCRRDFFRPEVVDGRSSKCNRCRPCTMCAYDERVTFPCTPIQDTKCTPLCGDGFYLDRLTRTCLRNIIIKHELFVEESMGVATVASSSEITALTTDRRVTNQPPSRHLKTFGRASQGRHGSSRVVDAETEEQSPEYLTSLFAGGAAGIALLVLLVFVSVYVALRIKQWCNYKMALEDRAPCHCTLLLCCACAHCKHGNSSRSTTSEADYSIGGNRNSALRHGHQQQRRTPIGIKVTRVKAPAESKSTPGIDSKECQEDSVDELETNRLTGTELSSTNTNEHGIEQTVRTSCEAASPACDHFEIPTFLGVETVM